MLASFNIFLLVEHESVFQIHYDVTIARKLASKNKKQ